MEQFSGAGGLPIAWQAWRTETQPRAVVVISHGLGEHSGRYGNVVEELVPRGYHVYALDHRGHGHSGGPRAYTDRMANVVADLDALVVLAESRESGLPVFLLGHSLGGCIALEYALGHHERLRGLALSGPVAALESASPAAR